jgi:hypothetical protein
MYRTEFLGHVGASRWLKADANDCHGPDLVFICTAIERHLLLRPTWNAEFHRVIDIDTGQTKAFWHRHQFIPLST